MFPRDRRHLRSRHQTLRGDLRLLRGRTIATPGRPLDHLKPTDAARLRDVQLDVHFAVYTHTNTSLTRGKIRTLPSLSARGHLLSAYVRCRKGYSRIAGAAPCATVASLRKAGPARAAKTPNPVV